MPDTRARSNTGNSVGSGLTLLLGVGLFLLSGCGGLTGFKGAEVPTETQVTLTGMVTRSDTSASVSGARVVFGGNVTTTAADGSYTFDKVLVTTRNRTRQTTTVTAYLSVSRNQFDAVVDELSFLTGESITHDVPLDPNPNSGTVTGKVVSAADTTPIADALVAIGEEELDTRLGRTASDGTFQITGLFPGLRPARIEKNGFLAFTGNVDVVDSSEGPVVDVGTIRMVPSSAHVSVSGTVQDGETGNGIVGALVAIADKSATTGASGAFTISDVPVGSQTVRASATGYISVEFGASIESPPTPLNIVLYRSGVDPPGSPYNLTGAVTLSDTPDASGVAVVAIEKSSGTTQDSATTNQTGVYKLFVPPSEYTVRASHAGYQSEERTVTIPPGGQAVSGVDFTLTRSAAVLSPKAKSIGRRRR